MREPKTQMLGTMVLLMQLSVKEVTRQIREDGPTSSLNKHGVGSKLRGGSVWRQTVTSTSIKDITQPIATGQYKMDDNRDELN